MLSKEKKINMQNHVYKNITNFKPKNPKELLFYANFFTFKRFFTTNKILFSPLPANNPSGTTNSTKILTQNISSGLTGPIQSNLTNSTITLSTGINKCMTSVKPSSILNSPTKKPLVLPNNKYTIKVSDKALGPRNKGDFLIPYLAVRATKPIETEDGYFIDQKHAIIIREDEYYDHQKKTLELITASTTIPSSYVTALQNNSLRIDKQDKNQFFNFTEVYRKDWVAPELFHLTLRPKRT